MRMTGFEKTFVNNDGHSQHVAAHALTRIKELPLESGWRYLDVGCGNGAAPLLIAQSLPLLVTGVDVDPAQIQVAAGRAVSQQNLRFLAHDATQLPFDDGAFDLVSSYKTTHHIPRWRAALDEMLRVLRPGGYFIYEDLPRRRFWQCLAEGRWDSRRALPWMILFRPITCLQYRYPDQYRSRPSDRRRSLE